ncbi:MULTISPECIES: hypothetical protein [unclassified Paenibacillus]|uniref:hypothetical protein n=1 Tax=unclassified Paenibacillus TaxID=185978 RepID=UPI001AEB99E0|nr:MULTISPECIES: hypothetical protein [unclassified Paenibacillus]MBP1155089.1 BMFP domain-containing protein YqiC [Paenibacillus sp. PvP091]MBP1169527.1 BMFP domain-containing protein YqiC [Paenibacillus sp. PvR098]MBP2440555.1 BMFP domain-containing protein YqiC [Paenibacillus sp. PvP052]
MPETFRSGRIAEFVQRLIWRKHALVEQMELPELADMKQITQGQVQALDMVIREMIQEFEIQEEDLK